MELKSPVAPELAQMTFPVYRHLIPLQPAPRHPEQGDRKTVQPIAIAARLGVSQPNIGFIVRGKTWRHLL